jgi:hypothetical protein
MYFLIPLRFTLPQPHDATLERLQRLVSGQHIDLLSQTTDRARLYRLRDQHEWLAPVAYLRWDRPQTLRVTLHPRRWLRHMLQAEIIIFLLLMTGLILQAQYFIATIILGMVMINHTFIYLMMRRRFHQTSTWLRDQLGQHQPLG